MAKTMKDYINTNDFEGAVERLEHTNKTWKNKWWETCLTIYNNCKEWAKQYTVDVIAKTFHKIKNAVSFKLRKEDISLSKDCPSFNNGDRVQKCYLIEFFDKEGKTVCSKVGTTIRTIQTRIREELNSETYKKMGAVSCLIHRVYDCGSYPAEGLESFFRAKYIKKFPDSFCKNDRFIKQVFDLEEADRIYAEYCA
jgi:hypothetical protein